MESLIEVLTNKNDYLMRKDYGLHAVGWIAVSYLVNSNQLSFFCALLAIFYFSVDVLCSWRKRK